MPSSIPANRLASAVEQDVRSSIGAGAYKSSGRLDCCGCRPTCAYKSSVPTICSSAFSGGSSGSAAKSWPNGVSSPKSGRGARWVPSSAVRVNSSQRFNLRLAKCVGKGHGRHATRSMGSGYGRQKGRKWVTAVLYSAPANASLVYSE